jgi:hypothetical protein
MGTEQVVLFRIGLALLELNEEALCSLVDPELICDVLRKVDMDSLFQVLSLSLALALFSVAFAFSHF